MASKRDLINVFDARVRRRLNELPEQTGLNQLKDDLRKAEEAHESEVRAAIKALPGVRNIGRYLTFCYDRDGSDISLKRTPQMKKLKDQITKAEESYNKSRDDINRTAEQIREKILLHGADADVLALIENF